MKRWMAIIPIVITMTLAAPASAEQAEITFDESAKNNFMEVNRKYIHDAIDAGRIDEVKTALSNYLNEHQDNQEELNEVISAIDEYGDYEGIVGIYDEFDDKTVICYDGYTDIDENHNFYFTYDYSNKFTVGFVADDWIFANSATLKILDIDGENNGIRFYGNFEHDVLDGGKVKEWLLSSFYDEDLDYLLNDMSGKVVIRFSGDDGELDFELNDQDKEALRNIGKYLKLKDVLGDIYEKYHGLAKASN